MFPVMREQIEEKIAQWVDDLERTPYYPYLNKIVTDEDVEKLCEVVEKMFDNWPCICYTFPRYDKQLAKIRIWER